MRYIGVERNTDMRALNTEIVNLGRSFRHAREWLKAQPGFAFPAAADESLPVPAQNWHRRIRMVLEVEPGTRRPTAGQIRDRQERDSTRTYPRSRADVAAELWIPLAAGIHGRPETMRQTLADERRDRLKAAGWQRRDRASARTNERWITPDGERSYAGISAAWKAYQRTLPPWPTGAS